MKVKRLLFSFALLLLFIAGPISLKAQGDLLLAVHLMEVEAFLS